VTPSNPILVLADDLTGAAELAAVGHDFGLPAGVATGRARSRRASLLLVRDTDTRLAAANEAARTVARAAGRLPRGAWIYKKVDSVLRGNVLAEVEALARQARRSRVLLVPANPGMGRTICDGAYFVHGVPIHRTAFAHDPHHPATSPRVMDRLGAPRSFPVHILRPGSALPAVGVLVGEVRTPRDLAHWARRVDGATLPAGGAEFFAAWLRTLGHVRHPPRSRPGLEAPVLVVSGTTAPAGRKNFLRLGSPEFPRASRSPNGRLSVPAAALRGWIDRLAGDLATRGLAVALAPDAIDARPGARDEIRRIFAALVRHLHARHAFVQIAVEGGATAAAVVQALGWSELTVAGAWAPGIVTLQPARAPRCRLTIKPGSYPWPGVWWRQLRDLGRHSTP
jgi:D-threonate/D-erythronate kinase